MSKYLKNRDSSDVLVRELITAILDRQEKRGDNRADAHAYTLGYLSSMMASILADSTKARAYVKDTLSYIQENRS